MERAEILKNFLRNLRWLCDNENMVREKYYNKYVVILDCAVLGALDTKSQVEEMLSGLDKDTREAVLVWDTLLDKGPWILSSF